MYDGYIAKYKPFHGVKLQELTPTLLQSYYNEQLKAGLSPNTVRKHHANIHRCLEYAVRLGMIPVNPSTMTELPPKRKYQGATAYTPEQLKDLLQLFQDDPLETPVELTVTYGLRRSEVCGLRWDAVDFDAGPIHVCHTAVMAKGKAVYALRKGGCDAKDIQAWLGHSDITTTLNVYGHVLGRDMDRLGQVVDKALFCDARVSWVPPGFPPALRTFCGT